MTDLYNWVNNSYYDNICSDNVLFYNIDQKQNEI